MSSLSSQEIVSSPRQHPHQMAINPPLDHFQIWRTHYFPGDLTPLINNLSDWTVLPLTELYSLSCTCGRGFSWEKVLNKLNVSFLMENLKYLKMYRMCLLLTIFSPVFSAVLSMSWLGVPQASLSLSVILLL